MPEMLHVPDPTDRTIETLHREVEQLADKLTTEMLHKEELGLERHRSVQTQFELMESHRLELKDIAERARVEQKEDSKIGVDAALTAQKEAVKEATIATNLANAKSEAAMTKALEQMAATFTAALSSVTGVITDVKDRVVGIEQYRRGETGNNSEKRMDTTLLFQVLAVAVAIYLGLNK